MLRPIAGGTGIAHAAEVGQAATRPMVKLPGQRLAPPAPQTLGTVICAQVPSCNPVASTGQAKSVTSPLPTSAALSVRVATPPALTGWAQGAAAVPGAAGARDGQRSEPAVLGGLALWNSMAVTPLPGAPTTCAVSVMAPALSGTHMHGLLVQAVPLPTARPPTLAPMLVTGATGTA